MSAMISTNSIESDTNKTSLSKNYLPTSANFSIHEFSSLLISKNYQTFSKKGSIKGLFITYNNLHLGIISINSISFWNLQTSQKDHEIIKQNTKIARYSLSDDKKTIVCSYKNSTTIIWDLVDKCRIQKLKHTGILIYGLSLNKDKKTVDFVENRRHLRNEKMIQCHHWDFVNNIFEKGRQILALKDFQHFMSTKLKCHYKKCSENREFLLVDNPPELCYLCVVDGNDEHFQIIRSPAMISLESERMAIVFKDAKHIEKISEIYQNVSLGGSINDDSICVIDIASMEILGFLPSQETIFPLRFTPDGHFGLFLSITDHVQVWDIYNFLLIATFPQSQYINHISISSDLHLMALFFSCSENISLQNLANMETLLTIKKNPGSILKHIYIQKLNKIIIAHEDNTVRLWDLITLNNVIITGFYREFYNNLAVFYEKYVCVRALNGHTFLFDAESERVIFDVKCFRVSSFGLSLDCRFFVCAEKNIRFWSLDNEREKGKELGNIIENKNFIVTVGFKKDLKIFVTGDVDFFYRVWSFKKVNIN